MATTKKDGIACPNCGGGISLPEIRRQLEPTPGASFDAEVSSLLDLVVDVESKREDRP
jgi:hypothetical protein